VAVLCSALLVLGSGAAHAQSSRADSTRRDSLQRLPEVRVTTDKTKMPERASSVVALPAAIRTTPATNVWDVVRQTAGIEVHQQGQGPGFASDAVIRGFTSDHSTDVALMVDGVPVNQPANGHAEGYADWNSVFPDVVSSIRVSKGPASPFIGNFAMGGQVEVQTIPFTAGTRWSARSGSYGDGRLSVVTGDLNDHAGWVAAADAQREDGWRANSGANIEHVLLNRQWIGDSGSTTSIGFSGSTAHWKSPGFVSVANFDAGALHAAVDPTDGGNLLNGTLRGALTRNVGGGTLSSLLWVRQGEWHIFLNVPPEGGIGEGAPSQTEEFDRRTGSGGYTRFSHATSFGDISAGLDYQFTAADYDRYFTTRRVRDSASTQFTATYFAVAPVLDAHINLSPALSVGVGGRIDRLDYGSKEPGASHTSDAHIVATPKLSVLYRLNAQVSTYAAFNGGFRSADGSAEQPSLAPSQEWASEVGTHVSTTHFDGSLALFNVDVRNEQTIDPVTLVASAHGSSRRRGVELDGRIGVVPAAALFAHATLNDAHYLTLLTDDGDNLSGANVFGVAKATIEAGVDFDTHGVRGSLWTAYTGPFTPIGEPDVRTAAYTLLHFRATMPLGHRWSAGIGVQNLLDTRYPELRASGYVSPGQPRTLLVTLSTR
jgi:outer membrane cobalamin receptor